MSNEIKGKPNLKELRKNPQFMKTIYDQQYTDADKSLNQVAKYLEELTGTSVTGKTIGNDFKGYGLKLRAPRKAPDYKSIRDLGKIDASKLKTAQDRSILIQNVLAYFKMVKWNKFAPTHSMRPVPEDVLEVIGNIALGGIDIEKIREHGKELAKRDKEIRKLKQRIVELESERSSFITGIQKYATGQSKNPLI